MSPNVHCTLHHMLCNAVVTFNPLQLSILVHPDKNDTEKERAQLAFDGRLYRKHSMYTVLRMYSACECTRTCTCSSTLCTVYIVHACTYIHVCVIHVH